MTESPVFTEAELLELNLDLKEQVQRASDDNPARATELLAQRLRAHERSVGGLRLWLAILAEERMKAYARGASRLTADEIEARWLAQAAEINAPAPDEMHLPLREGPATTPEAFTGGLTWHQYQDQVEVLRVRHRTFRDAVSIGLGDFYLEGGPDELEKVLRISAMQTLVPWMRVDVQRDLRTRALVWLNLLRGNFAEVEISERDSVVALAQQPCGTCGRQVEEGRYGPGEPQLPMVIEEHPVTWGRGSVPIYRCHVAVMHDIVPTELIGHRWPWFECPRQGRGACIVRIEPT